MGDMPELVIASANVKNRLFGIGYVVRRRGGVKPDSVGISEAYGLVNQLALKFPGYRSFWGVGGADTRRGASDTPILVRKHLPMLAAQSIKASDASTPDKIAPDRFITVVGFEHSIGDVAHIHIHPHAVTAGLSVKVDRVAETAKFVRALRLTIVYYQRLGYKVVVTGDGNFPERGKSPDWIDLNEMFKSIHFEVDYDGIDIVAWNPLVLTLGKVVRYTRAQVRSDHPAGRYHFTAR